MPRVYRERDLTIGIELELDAEDEADALLTQFWEDVNHTDVDFLPGETD
jgi:hypothetical protein